MKAAIIHSDFLRSPIAASACKRVACASILPSFLSIMQSVAAAFIADCNLLSSVYLFSVLSAAATALTVSAAFTSVSHA